MSFRQKGVEVCRKHGLEATARIVQHSCYRDIFRSAVLEVGVDRAVEIIAEEEHLSWAVEIASRFSTGKWNPIAYLPGRLHEWVNRVWAFLGGDPKLSRAQVNRLSQVVVKVGGPGDAYHFAHFVSGLEKSQINRLLEVVVEAGDPSYAHFFVCNIPGLDEDQENRLREVRKSVA